MAMENEIMVGFSIGFIVGIIVASLVIVTLFSVEVDQDEQDEFDWWRSDNEYREYLEKRRIDDGK
jgi:hypothetical protein